MRASESGTTVIVFKGSNLYSIPWEYIHLGGPSSTNANTVREAEGKICDETLETPPNTKILRHTYLQLRTISAISPKRRRGKGNRI
jgi:hypothetical protein